MNAVGCAFSRSYCVRIFTLACGLIFGGQAQAQPTIVSTVPANGANGVSTSATLVITFSEAMNINATAAYLVDSTTLGIIAASAAWSGGNRVLTCTPTAALPANRTIWWTVNGQNPAGMALSGSAGGIFTTAGGLLLLTNAAWSGGSFGFDVTSAAGQTVTILYSSTLSSNQWQPLLTTNCPGVVHIVDPQSATNRYLFYRARIGG